MNRIKVFVLMILFSILVFYFGGWDILWGGVGGASVLDANRAAIGINNNLYGLIDTHRFFNSHIIAWILFAFALFIAIRAFIILIFGSKD